VIHGKASALPADAGPSALSRFSNSLVRGEFSCLPAAAAILRINAGSRAGMTPEWLI